MKISSGVLVFLRIAVGTLFVFSGFSKLVASQADFLAVVLGYQVVYGAAAVKVAVVLPWVELMAGAFLAFGLWKRLALDVLWMLNTLFIGVIVSALVRGIAVQDCGCFGEGALSFSLPQVLVMDLGLWCVLALLAIKKQEVSRFSLDRLFAVHR